MHPKLLAKRVNMSADCCVSTLDRLWREQFRRRNIILFMILILCLQPKDARQIGNTIRSTENTKNIQKYYQAERCWVPLYKVYNTHTLVLRRLLTLLQCHDYYYVEDQSAGSVTTADVVTFNEHVVFVILSGFLFSTVSGIEGERGR